MIKRYFRYLRSAASKMYQADILTLLEPNPDALMLDVGCDDGEWTECLLSKVGCRSAVGIDVVDRALLSAGRKCLQVVKSDISDGFPFRDCTIRCYSLQSGDRISL